MTEIKILAVTKQEAELIMDSFKVSNPITRNIALKASGLVMEWAAEEDVDRAAALALKLITAGSEPAPEGSPAASGGA